MIDSFLYWTPEIVAVGVFVLVVDFFDRRGML